MAAAKYYVLSRTLWQGDEWDAIAGPFTNKTEADKVADEKSNDGWSEPVWSEQHKAHWAPTQDLKRVVNTRVVNTTEMKHTYGISVEKALETIYWTERNETSY